MIARKSTKVASDWRVLFLHPADFMPVCTTEFMAFARAFDKFQERNCDLLGLSIDSNHAHVAGVRSIKDKFGVDIPFPIMEDPCMAVATACGMIQPGASDTSAVRATFVIDPEGMRRAMVYYPMRHSRSVDEFLRPLTALQTADEHGAAKPEKWQPGDKVIVPPPQTAESAEKRQSEGYDYTVRLHSTTTQAGTSARKTPPAEWRPLVKDEGG